MALPKFVHVQECGPRDGLQIEAKALSVSEKAELIGALIATGIKEIEIGLLVKPEAVPKMADTPEVIGALPHAPEGVSYRVVYLNTKGLERAKAFTNKIDLEGRLMIAASDAFSRRNANRTVAETLAELPEWIGAYEQDGRKATTLGVMTAFGCNFEGAVSPARVMDLVERIKDMMEQSGGALERLSLMDTMGWATPDSIKRMIGLLRARWPDLAINLHLHDTRGLAMASAYAALELGVADFDGSIGGLGGCPFAGHSGAAGNICTEDFVLMCHELGIETGIDLEALLDVARRAERLVGRELPGKAMKSGSLASKRGVRA
jgi:hydroxymethylglutaryl-CoA lyase